MTTKATAELQCIWCHKTAAELNGDGACSAPDGDGHLFVRREPVTTKAQGMATARGEWIARPTAGHDVHGQSVIYDENSGKDIAIVYDGDAHAELIVRAVNSFDELVAALTAAKYFVNHRIIDGNHAELGNCERCSIDEALRKAGAL